MLLSLSILLSSVFLVLAGLHFYWAFGGNWAFEEALPTNEQGEKLLNPKKLDCVIVALGLSSFAALYLIRANLWNLALPNWIFDYGPWLISAIFLLRAIGDFHYVGFFKTLKDTPFGRRDTVIYSPLCLAIALAGFVLIRIS